MRTAGRFEQETVSGALVDLLGPDPADIRLADMVHHLSRTCRYLGGCRPHYSVAQHSCIVAGLLKEEDRIHGLLHDGHEYLLGDMASPVKETIAFIVADFKRGWNHLTMVADRAIYQAAGVPMPNEEQRAAVKRADLVALAIEQREILVSPNRWNLPYPATNARIVPVGAMEAELMFRDALEECGVRVGFVN